MMVNLSIRSGKRVEMIDVTPEVQEALREMGVADGICTIYVPHTTAGVTINEGADPAVCQDIMEHFSQWAPHSGRYRHFEGNADAHIKVAAVGSSETVIVDGGRLRLGRWQRIFFCEFDGPRSRSLWVKALGASSSKAV
jgi:secondary thiamine-phosphate synthase enzyme